jgi:hypothetical protein
MRSVATGMPNMRETAPLRWVVGSAGLFAGRAGVGLVLAVLIKAPVMNRF